MAFAREAGVGQMAVASGGRAAASSGASSPTSHVPALRPADGPDSWVPQYPSDPHTEQILLTGVALDWMKHFPPHLASTL